MACKTAYQTLIDESQRKKYDRTMEVSCHAFLHTIFNLLYMKAGRGLCFPSARKSKPVQPLPGR